VNCEAFMSRLWEYFESKLSKSERDDCEEHASTCEPCSELLAKCHELTCRQFVEFLNDYLDDTLPADRHIVMDRHLEVCPECQRYLAGYRSTIALTKSARWDELGEVPSELFQAVIDAMSEDDGAGSR
jgi:anti-sigma factor RsiW